MVKDAKGFISCAACRYRWNWKNRTFCFNCNATLVPQEMPWRDAPAQGVWADASRRGAAALPPACPPGTWQRGAPPGRADQLPGRAAPPQPGGLATTDLLVQLRERVGASGVGQAELQALEGVLSPQPAAQPPAPPRQLLEATISAKGVACRRAQANLEAMVAREDEAEKWYNECKDATAEAVLAAYDAKKAWQEELALELRRAGGANPSSGNVSESAASGGGGSQINLSQLLSAEGSGDTVEIIDGDILDLSDLEIEEGDRQRWLELKASMGKEIQQAVLSAIGPSAENIQKLRQEAREMRQRLAAKRARREPLSTLPGGQPAGVPAGNAAGASPPGPPAGSAAAPASAAASVPVPEDGAGAGAPVPADRDPDGVKAVLSQAREAVAAKKAGL